MKKHTLAQIKTAVKLAVIPTPYSTTLLKKITDARALTSLGIMCMQAADIRAITKNSGPLATSNEYQVHYWFLNGRFTFGNNVYVDIAFPTVYFNYAQKVSSAAINFELDAVDVMSEALQPVHNTKVNELMANKAITGAIAALETILTQKMGACTFKWSGVNLGTIHRHPGRLSSFSSTDLATSVTSPGICYPFGPLGPNDIVDKPSFSSIMLHENGDTVIGRTEYRTATSPTPEHVHYKKHRCITFVHDEPTTPDILSVFLGEVPTTTNYIKADCVTEEQLKVINIHKLILNALATANYSASTKFVNPDNVTKLVYTAPKKAWPINGNHKGVKTKEETVPHRNSKKWRTIAAEVEDCYGYPLIPYSMIITKTPIERSEYYDELFEAVYDKNPVSDPATLLPMDVIKLQEKIWLFVKKDINGITTDLTDDPFGLEEDYFMTPLLPGFDLIDSQEDYDTMSLSEICNDLRTWGVAQSVIDSSTSKQLIKIWKKSSGVE